MLRWRRDRVRVVLTPEQTLVLRPASGRAGATSMQRLEALETEQAQLALIACLASPAWHASDVEVLVSNAWIGYALSAAPGALLGPAEEHALAQATICRVYGGRPENWQVSMQSQPPDAGVLAAGLPRVRMDTLRAIFRQAAVSRLTVRPLLDHAARTLRHTLRSGWWVVVEPGWWVVLQADRSVWRYVQGQPCGADWPQHLASHLRRTQNLTGDRDRSSQVLVQPIACQAPATLTYPPGWSGKMVAPRGATAWPWETI